MAPLRILFVGDVVGKPGRSILARALARLRKTDPADLVVVNGENCAGGAGLTPQTVDEIFVAGTDVVTSGNHVWDRKEILPRLESDPRILRPANFPPPAPGSGRCRVTAADGTPVVVMNLMGRVFMGGVDDPFRAVDSELGQIDDTDRVILVDFHAEATSEKIAFGRYLDGRVSAVLGTHTHVPTADATILPGGTAYMTDVGMTGPYDSVIGVNTENVLERFLTQRPVRYTTAEADRRFAGVMIEVDRESGRAESIRRLELSDSDFKETR